MMSSNSSPPRGVNKYQIESFDNALLLVKRGEFVFFFVFLPLKDYETADRGG